MYRVLLVDDDRAIRYQLKRVSLWNKHGFVIKDEAVDGQEALEKIIVNEFDVAFVDIRMPRISGIQLLAELREQKKDICVVILSGHSDFSYARQGMKLGAFDYIVKPIDEEGLARLLIELKSHLDEKSTQLAYQSQKEQVLRESLMLPYSTHEEMTLFRYLIEKPQQLRHYASEIVKKLFDFYDHDLFKAATVLESSYQNLFTMLFDKLPFLHTLAAFNNNRENNHLHVQDSLEQLSEAFIGKLLALSSNIINLHLDKPDAVIRCLCEYVIENLDKELTLESAAERLGYNSKYLGKLFREKTGEGFVDYITRIKMERAKVMLQTGKYRNYEISERLGYKNPDYFCLLFKKYYGVTPTCYRKHQLNSENHVGG